MKTRLLIIIGIIVIITISALVAGTFAYQQVYNQRCIDGGDRVTGFLRCTGMNCDFGIPMGSVGISIPKSASIVKNNLNIHPEMTSVTLGINNTVMWINHDRESITFVGNDDSWTTGEIFSWASKRMTFNETGEFEYHSESYPWLNGKITVRDSNKN